VRFYATKWQRLTTPEFNPGYRSRRAQCEVYLSPPRRAASPVCRERRVTERASILDLLIGRLTRYAQARLACLLMFDTVNYFI
jgi:hypothetical protein